MKATKQLIHFSFDDVHSCLKDITDHADSYQSVFDNAFFAWMKNMHSRYGAVFSLYTFNAFQKDPSYSISNLPDLYAQELAACSHWLKFGFHARDEFTHYDEETVDQALTDYAQFLKALTHATGKCDACLDRVIRLGFFAGTEEIVYTLHNNQGILGLLTADSDNSRKSYHFDEVKRDAVNKRGEYWDNGILFLRSQPRAELVERIDSLMCQIGKYTEPKVIELFTHEYSMGQECRSGGSTIQALCEEVIRCVYEAGYEFGFAQDVYF